MRCYRILLLTLLVLITTQVYSRSAEYVVKAVGFKVVHLTLEMDPIRRIIRAEAKSLTTTSVFPSIDNSYSVKYEKGFLPLEYERYINQDNAKGRVLTRYNRPALSATQIGESENDTFAYDIDTNTRDFFSFLGFVSENRPGSGDYLIDANGTAWDAKLTLIGSEKLRTSIGQFMTKVYEIRLDPRMPGKVPYVDMFTNNLFNKDTYIKIWIAEQGIAVKAQVSRDLANTTWEIVSFEQ